MSQGLCGDMPIYHIISKLSVYQWPYNEVLKLRLQEALADLLNFSTDFWTQHVFLTRMGNGQKMEKCLMCLCKRYKTTLKFSSCMIVSIHKFL